MAELSIKGFPDDLMHELKVTALDHKMTLKEFVTEKLQQLVKGDQPGHSKKKG